MKKIRTSLFIMVAATGIFANVNGQNTQPTWTQDINPWPDTIAHITPVKVVCDANGNVIVLSNYIFNGGGSSNTYSIYLRKYNSIGNILWTYVDSSSGIPYATDMTVDTQGNVYLVGGYTSPFSGQTLVEKISTMGSLVWQHTGNSAFSIDTYTKIIFKNNMLYLSAYSGIVKYDLSGVEQWANTNSTNCMAVDNLGRVIYSGYDNGNTLFRLNEDGTFSFADSTISAQRISVDYANNIYLLSSNYPDYDLVKYDSAGVQEWQYNQFPIAPAFGDIGMEVVIDGLQDIYAIGLSDTIFKFSPNGSLQWKKPMDDMDGYLVSTTLNGNGLLIAGSTQGFGGYNLKVSLFNRMGNVAWTTTYNGIVNGQEFLQSMAMDAYGLYLLGNLEQNTRLIQYANPFYNQTPDYNLICVDSVWYSNSSGTAMINVRLFNGSLGYINYPTVQIVSPTGDTISNPYNLVSFFAHIFNTYQTYTDTISVSGIADFSNYTFLLSTNFGNDTTVAIQWCMLTSIADINLTTFNIYPNPANDLLTIDVLLLCASCKDRNLTVYDIVGNEKMKEQLTEEHSVINIQHLSSGLYFLKIGNSVKKFVKE